MRDDVLRHKQRQLNEELERTPVHLRPKDRFGGPQMSASEAEDVIKLLRTGKLELRRDPTPEQEAIRQVLDLLDAIDRWRMTPIHDRDSDGLLALYAEKVTPASREILIRMVPIE